MKSMRSFRLTGMPMTKILMFVFSGLLLLIGVSYLGVGGWLLNSMYYKPATDAIRDYYKIMGAIMLPAGILGVILAFYGMFLSFYRGIVLLSVYLFLIVIDFLYGVSIGIAGLAISSRLRKQIAQKLNSSKYLSIETLDLMDEIQSQYKCCGLNKPQDWYTVFELSFLPSSCCLQANDFNCENSSYYPNGCVDTVSNAVKSDIATAGGISLGIAIPLIFGIVFAISSLIELIDQMKPANVYKTSANH